MKVARINGGWPARDRFDDAARKARDRGIEVPLIDVIDRFLKPRHRFVATAVAAASGARVQPQLGPGIVPR